jgi:predicted extracellular nuclease
MNNGITARFLVLASALALAASANGAIIVSEVHPSGSGNAPYAADFFEITNTGAAAVGISGWKMDDNSNSFGVSVALTGVTTIGPGESVIFIETATPAATIASFLTAWFGVSAPAGLQIGTYSGSGVGLSTSGDAVNIFDGAGTRITGINVPASTTGVTFDNAAGAGSATLPLPTVSTLSVAGTNGAFLAPSGEVGSPGTIPAPFSGGLLALAGLGAAKRSRRA